MQKQTGMIEATQSCFELYFIKIIFILKKYF
jgi:hypothetical protein